MIANNDPEQLSATTAESEDYTTVDPAVSPTLSKVQLLQREFYKACGELFNNIDYVGGSLSNLMLNHYEEQYKREYERMNAEEFIEVDKLIEQLKIKRDKELEAINLEHDKLRAELKVTREKALAAIQLERDQYAAELKIERDNKLKEIELEHERQLAEIARKRKKMQHEIDVLAETTKIELETIAAEIVPDAWRRFGLFGRICTNHAMELALDAAETARDKYFLERESKVAEGAAELAAASGLSEEESQAQNNQRLKYRKSILKRFTRQRRIAHRNAANTTPETSESVNQQPAQSAPGEAIAPATTPGRETKPESSNVAGPTVTHL